MAVHLLDGDEGWQSSGLVSVRCSDFNSAMPPVVCVFQYEGVNCAARWTHGDIWTIDLYFHIICIIMWLPWVVLLWCLTSYNYVITVSCFALVFDKQLIRYPPCETGGQLLVICDSRSVISWTTHNWNVYNSPTIACFLGKRKWYARFDHSHPDIWCIIHCQNCIQQTLKNISVFSQYLTYNSIREWIVRLWQDSVITPQCFIVWIVRWKIMVY